MDWRAGTGGPRWVRRLLAGSVAALLVTSASVAYLRQGAHVVSVDDALEGYRRGVAASTTTTAAPVAAASNATQAPPGDAPTPTTTVQPGAPAAPAAPTTTAPRAASGPAPATIEEGVYTMATSGYEETNALGGARHDYPDETAVTMRRVECGYVQRWQPLAERWDESELCREPEGFAVRRFTTYHEFFQRGQQQDFTCPADTYVYKPAASPGDTWKWGCSNDASAIETTTTFIGIEDITIGGKTMRAAHVHYESVMSGGNRGTQVQDRWLQLDTGFNLRIKTDVDTEADSPFGPVHYEEHYTITVTSLTPRR